MDRKFRRKYRLILSREDGYLLLTTIYVLLASTIFFSSMIHIVSSQMIQYRQYSHAYQAKSALQMSKNLLQNELVKQRNIQTGVVHTSKGDVIITSNSTDGIIHYYFEITSQQGIIYRDELIHKENKILETTENISE
ncbi:MAG TPA: hypothetical protein VFC64_05885 [Atopostipes sp.]|nr:hypothetical protein [Atopostipes sp.]